MSTKEGWICNKGGCSVSFWSLLFYSARETPLDAEFWLLLYYVTIIFVGWLLIAKIIQRCRNKYQISCNKTMHVTLLQEMCHMSIIWLIKVIEDADCIQLVTSFATAESCLTGSSRSHLIPKKTRRASRRTTPRGSYTRSSAPCTTCTRSAIRGCTHNGICWYSVGWLDRCIKGCDHAILNGCTNVCIG